MRAFIIVKESLGQTVFDFLLYQHVLLFQPLSSNVISKVTNVSTSSVTGGQKLVAGQLPGQTIIAGQLPGQTLVAGQLPGQTAVAGQLPGQALIAGQFPLSNRTSASPDPTRKVLVSLPFRLVQI